VKPSQAVAPDAIEPSFEEFDLTAFISEELLDRTPVHSISAPASAEDLTTARGAGSCTLEGSGEYAAG
jgi:hypothetical protein